MNHTRFPKEDHLPYWASGQQSYEEWSCRMLYWTGYSTTQIGMLINVWRLAGDALNITFKFLYCNHQMHRVSLITLYFILNVLRLFKFLLRRHFDTYLVVRWTEGNVFGSTQLFSLRTVITTNLHQHRNKFGCKKCAI